MQEEQKLASSQPQQVYDAPSRTTFSLNSGQITAETDGKRQEVWSVPPIQLDNRTTQRTYLHFATPTTTHLTINPWGNVLTSNSERFQEAELSEELSTGSTWWQLFVPHTILSLTVGVKDKKSNQYFNFDFSMKDFARLTFKLNATHRTFKVWVNGVQSESKPAINLPENCSWTPFIRIRESGTTIALNPFVEDPEGQISKFNIFTDHQNAPEIRDEEEKIEENELIFKKDETFQGIQLMKDHLLLVGTESVRVVPRSCQSGQFELDKLVQMMDSGDKTYFVVKLKQGEYSVFKEAFKVWKKNVLGTITSFSGSLWIKKTKEQWLEWSKSISKYLDSQLSSNANELAYQVYEVTLSIISKVFSALNIPQPASRWNKADRFLVNEADRHSLRSLSNCQAGISSHLSLTNSPAIHFSQKVLGVNSFGSYLSIRLEDSKISIFSIRGVPFKFGDFILSKAIKKESELTQSAKEADQIKGTLGQPTIYKILKNCLKYADKVKPPEKLVKQLEESKKKLKKVESPKKQEVKEQGKVVPNKDLEGTLIQMGFDSKIVRQALIQCNNASLEAAMDLVLGGTIVIEEEKPPAPTKDWTCQTCTLVNVKTATVCVACDSPMPPMVEEVSKKEEQKVEQIMGQIEVIEEEIKSQRIEEPLSQIFIFETGVALAPIIVAGVFESTIRFRLFALNPRFFSSCYSKGDLFADLISHNFYQNAGQIPSDSVEKIFGYLSNNEKKERSLSWLPIEDIDIDNKGVKDIQFQSFGIEKKMLKFSATLNEKEGSKQVFFSFDSSKIYLEKQKSLVVSPQLKEELQKRASQPKQVSIEQSRRRFDYESQGNTPSEYEIYLHPTNKSKLQTSQVDLIAEQRKGGSALLPLHIVNSPQQTYSYPNINYTSPWSGSYNRKNLWKNGVVLGTPRQKLIQVDAVTLEIANSEDQIKGFIYFANDFTLKPLKLHRFAFSGVKKLQFNFEKIEAGYLVIVLEPHPEDKLIELKTVKVYGDILQDRQIPNPSSIKINLQKQPVFDIQLSSSNQKKAISPHQIQVFAVNASHDLSLQPFDKIEEYTDLKIIAHIDSTGAENVVLKNVELNGYSTLRVNTILRSNKIKKTSAQMDEEFTKSFKEYLLTRDRKLLHQLVSSSAERKRDQADLTDFPAYFKEIIALPYDISVKNDTKAFLRQYMPSIKNQKDAIELSKLVEQGLRSSSLTANGLEMIFWIGRESQAFTNQQLNSLFSEVVVKLGSKIQGNTKEYSIFDEKSIFSPYLHQLGKRDDSQKQLDRITSRMLMKKLRFSKLFTLDFFSCYKLRQLELKFDHTQTKNKMIVTLHWFNKNGELQGNLAFGYNYPVWNNLCAEKKSSNRILSIPLGRYDVETRYVQVQLSFTLQPFTASKVEIDNLTDNQIVPTFYGCHIGELDVLRKLELEVDPKNLRFIKRTGPYSKFCVSSKQQMFLFQEESVDHDEQSLQKLTDTLELKSNHEKWLSVMMRNPSQQSNNYHYTLFAMLAQQILKSKVVEAPSAQMMKSLLAIENKEVDKLLNLNERVLKLILENLPDTFLDVLRQPLDGRCLISIFSKNNPFSQQNNRKKVCQELKKKDKVIAKNCLHLFNQICDLTNADFKDIYIQLHQIYLSQNLFEQCISLYERNGWLQNLPALLINSISHQDQSDFLIQRICRSAKTVNDLSELLNSEVSKSGPTESLLLVLDQLAERTKNEPIDGNSFYKSALEWIDKPDPEENIPSNLVQRLLKASGSFVFNSDTLSTFVSQVFELKQRNILWTKLKDLPMMKQEGANEVLLNYSLKAIGNWINSPPQKRTENLDLFEFISHIFNFVDQPEQSQKNTEIIQLFGSFLFEQLNWGGREGCRYLSRKQSIYLTNVYHIARLCPLKQCAYAADNLIRWSILNHNQGQFSQNNSSAPGQFSYIQGKVWQMLIKCLQGNDKYAAKISDIMIGFLKNGAALNKTNRYLGVMLRNKTFTFILNLLKQLKSKPELHQTVKSLLDKQGFFRQILSNLESLSGIENQDNKIVKQDELANSLSLVGQPQPKDWLTYKSGAKNHVFQLKYQGKGYHSLCFEKQHGFWPSVVVVGFQTNSGAAGTVLAPRQVLVEVGQNKNKLSIVGNMSLIPFESFSGYSVKVFALNLYRLKSKFNPKNNLKSNKMIKLTFVSPYQGMVSDGAEVGGQVSTSKYISYVNFLSILGYAQSGPDSIPDDITSLIGTLQQLSDPRHIQDLTDLLTTEANVKSLQKSLKGISYLLSSDKYSNIAHKFLLRACQVNESLGQSMLNQYFLATNPVLSSKMVGQIVLTSDKLAVSRAKRYYNFIADKLSQECKDADVVPYITNFSQVVSTLQRNSQLSSSNQVQICQVSEKNIQFILTKATESPSFRRFASTILCASCPLTFQLQADGKNKAHLWDKLFKSQNSADSELLATIINSDPACLQWFIQQDYLNITFKKIFQSLQKTDQPIKEIVAKLNFFTLLCLNSKIKESVTKAQLDLQIFQLLVNGNDKGILANPESSELRQGLVNFIAVASLGSPNQRIIGTLLKDSLNTTVLEGSSKFVGQVFLPLLNSFSKTVVCLVPYSAEENKILADLSSLQHFQPPAKVEVKRSDKFKLGTMALSQAQKENLFDKVRESTGHKWGMFKLITSHQQLSSAKNLQYFKQALSKRKEILLILEANQKKYGIFYSSKELKKSNILLGTKNSFIFEVQNNEVKQLYKGNPQQQILSFNKVEDEQLEVLRIYSNEKVAVEIRYGGYSQSSVFVSAMNNSAFSKHPINSVQYWYFDSQSAQSYQSVWANENVFTKRLLSQLSECAFFKKQFKANSSLSLLRQELLFQFPSSISVKDLVGAIDILGKSTKKDAAFEIRLPNGGHVDQSSTLEQLAHGKNGERIVDLLVDLEGVVNSLDISSSSRKIQFLPLKGILKYFEENEGVKSMIKAIKKSISDWSNAVRKQKWMQYINEVEKFSGFPHFFGVYLREKQTFNLLLQILSGLPDKQTDTKWDEKEVQASQRLLKIVSDILNMENSQQFRAHAIKHDFLIIILGRLKILTGAFARHYEQNIEEEEVVVSSPDKKNVEDDGVKKVKKKKGVGYSAQTNSNTKWMKGDNLASSKKQFESVEPILNLIEGFLGGGRNWKAPPQLLKQILCSCLLPFIQECLRAGTLLEMSKHPEKYRVVLRLIRAITKQDNLVPALTPISKHYEPAQIESVESLLKSLNNTSKIFLSCLSQNLSEQDKISQALANDLIATYNQVDEAVIELANDEDDGGQIQHALSLPLDKKYRMLMKDLRFDYIDMKENATKIKHHYASNFNANYKPNQTKMIRLAQELADISTALPHQHTNAVYVRCDKDRVDFMQALIMGSNGTPYGHGAFLFDIYFDDNYPNGPPKVNLTTTGHGKIRFNPNLYACGKVCLSLLGTWRGSASQNWDSKVSTLLQVLLSIQAIIMSEEVYFNEPGFEGEQGTEEGQKKNEAYSNIVRFGNIKFAMLQNIKNPPKGFESVIRRHFYLKKDQILDECKKWLKYAEKRAANYVGLVNDHNSSWASQYKKTKTQYKDNLQKVVKELEEQLNKLPPPNISDLANKKQNKRAKKKKQVTDLKDLQKMQHEQIDVSYSNKMTEDKELDINDEKVRDRWSRYIGAMGIDAVSRQSKADILVIGLAPFALEVVKNLVLSGCRKLTIVDDAVVKLQDLSGGFFYQQEDIGKKRVQSALFKIKELNTYVKVETVARQALTDQFLSKYTLVFASELPFDEQVKMATLCREKKVKFMSADCFGAACRLTNDFGKFQVLDKNGEEPVQVMIKDIQCSENGLVTLLDGSKHPYEDGEAVVIGQVEGMKHKEDPSKSINGAIRKVKVINFKSFEIGDTRMYEPYVRNGTAKNIKTPVNLQFPPLQKAFNPEVPSDVDQELQYFDFAKQTKSALLRLCFITLDQFRKAQKRFPASWNFADSQLFKTYLKKNTKQQLSASDLKFASQFSFSCKGNLPPLCAFFGGLISQQIIKGITQKYKPVNPSFYLNFMELLPSKEEDKEWTAEEVADIYKYGKSRDEGLAAVVGRKLVDIVSESRVFMVGAGAIGCELLKNFAMVGLGTGESGKIIVTDPDHIQNSNLNRQFLFREKHISKPKSLTASASVTLMNPKLKDHVTSLLERVSESTRQIFSNRFFGGLTAVANALDNVAARRYVDQRCVQNQIALFESGTLGPKGHVQVIIPFKTQSYGSQNDPVEEGEIPHCTLKLFPEETLHCIEWARDIFGRKFALQPKALGKFLEKGYSPDSGDIKALDESLKMVTKGPKNFDDCIDYAIAKFYKYYRDDVMQLLYTYPLDAKTKNGEPFWRLPKRPPTPITKFDPEDALHNTFVMSLAVLTAKIYQIPFPTGFRTDKQKLESAKQASKIKIADFVPSDEQAKAILKESADDKKEGKDKMSQQPEEQKMGMKEEISSKNELQLHKQLLENAGNEFLIKAEQFQKDDDANGHIDFIYAAANLRALNYKLEPMDWITTKLKAGRIVPALVTTTSCVAGLQTLELLKYLKKTQIDQMRNVYLNLAVPSLQMSQPGELQKKKLKEGLEVTLWDKWELHCTEDVTFGQIYERLHKEYGLHPAGVLQGMSRVDFGKGQAEKKKFLSSKVLEKLDREEEYLDIVVLFTQTEEDDKILEGVPPVRLLFDKK